jgi:hypothetical protein
MSMGAVRHSRALVTPVQVACGRSVTCISYGGFVDTAAARQADNPIGHTVETREVMHD